MNGMWSIYSQTVMTPGFSFSFVFLGFSMSNQKWKTSLACLQSQILFCKVRWKGSENIWCTSHMFLITSINGSEGAWMQKSKQKTTIGWQSWSAMSANARGVRKPLSWLCKFQLLWFMMVTQLQLVYALQLFWESNYSLFINNNISWVYSFRFLQ